MSQISFPTRLNVGRKPGVNLALIRKRKAYIIDLWLAGMSPETILGMIQRQPEPWGDIRSVRSVQLVVQNHFRSVPHDLRYDAGMRDAHLAQQLYWIDKAVTYVLKKKRSAWKPHEYVSAIFRIVRMQQCYIDNMGWNATKLPRRKGYDPYHFYKTTDPPRHPNPTAQRLIEKMTATLEAKQDERSDAYCEYEDAEPVIA